MHGVLETEAFVASAKNAGLSEDEKFRLIDMLAENPTAGVLIKGTGGARKLRLARTGGGKRGGYRVVTYYAADDVPVFLMDVYAKGERIDLSQAERNELKKILRTVAADYRQSMKGKITRLVEKAS